MSGKELRRKTVMDEVVGGRRKLRSAAEVLGISYRQCRRVCQRYRQQGDRGLMHGNRGRESNRKIRAERRALVNNVVSEEIFSRLGLEASFEHDIELRKSGLEAAIECQPTTVFQ